MIRFEPPPRRSLWRSCWELPGKIWRKYNGDDWRAEFDAWDRQMRLDLARKMVSTINNPQWRAEMLEKIDQAEAQERDRQASQKRK